MDTKLLRDIGLTNNEITVYLALLKAGTIKAGELVREVDLHRSRVYDSINRLMEKGLVSSHITNRVRNYEAVNPDRLLTFMDEEEVKLKEKKRAIANIIPELKKQVNPLKPQAEAHVFLGVEGFKTMRRDVLRVGEDLYLIGAKGKEDKVNRYFFPQYDKMRIKQGIRYRVLADIETKGKAIMRLPMQETRYLPKEYSTPTVINIYGDRVVNVLWKGDYPLCFMIKNKDIADSYRKWFELLWKYSK